MSGHLSGVRTAPLNPFSITATLSRGLQCNCHLPCDLVGVAIGLWSLKGKLVLALFTRGLEVWNRGTWNAFVEQVCAFPMAEWPAELNLFQPVGKRVRAKSSGQGPVFTLHCMAAGASRRPCSHQMPPSEWGVHPRPLCDRQRMPPLGPREPCF